MKRLLMSFVMVLCPFSTLLLHGCRSVAPLPSAVWMVPWQLTVDSVHPAITVQRLLTDGELQVWLTRYSMMLTQQDIDARKQLEEQTKASLQHEAAVAEAKAELLRLATMSSTTSGVTLKAGHR